MRVGLISLAAAASLSIAAGAHAGPNLVSNGGFEQVSMPGGPAQISPTNVTGWSSPASPANGWTAGYNFIFSPGFTGSYTPEYNAYVGFWGNDGGSFISPAGGNFLASDGAFQTAAITQTINGLSPGAKYNLSFQWAAAQQLGFDGDTTEQWQVSLGAETHSTAIYQNPSHGFSGWMNETFTFTAQSTSAVLSFLAAGTPQGLPPFSLLDGVSLAAASVPEPASLALLGTISLLIGLFRLRRRPAR